MHKLLLVSATSPEAEPLLQFLQRYKGARPHTFIFGKLEIRLCITGVGMTATAFELGKAGAEDFDMAINLGIAGGFKYSAGEVLNVREDCFCELGAEDGDEFLSIDELGLGKQKVSLNNLLETESSRKLKIASAITVNKVHGNEQSISEIVKRLDPDLESMEGAAFIHAANAFNWRSMQLRAISNKVERRNRDKWDIPLAVKNLNEVVIEVIKDINNEQY